MDMGTKQNKIRRLAVLVLSACLVLAGCGGGKEVVQEAPELLELAGAVREDVYAQYRDVYSLEIMETVVLPRQEELGFERPGVLEKVNVYTGKAVKKGDVLAELRDDSKEQYERLEEQLAQMREDNAYNNRHLEIDIEIAELSGQSTARLEMQLKQMKELQALEEKYLLDQLEEAGEEQGGYQLIAPFSGTVSAIVDYREGMSFSVDMPLLVLVSEDERYLQVDYVSPKKMESSHEYYVMVDGKRYELEYLPYSTEEMQKLTAKNEKKVTRFRMVDAQNAGLGKNAFVCLVGEYRENVLSVPKSVLYKERRDYFVYKVEGENLVKIPVEVGVLGDAYAEILSGLEEGACVYAE